MVKHATHVRTKKQYAVKVMNVVEPTNEADLEEGGMTLPEIAEEIRLTMSLASPQVVRIYDFYQTPKHVYVLMEFLRGGELLDAVMNLGSYSEKDAAMIMKQLLTGLVKVHEQNITHRDLKLENLILAEKGKLDSLRIADFGLAKKHLDDNKQPVLQRRKADFRGTVSFASLNAHNNIDLSRRDDLWSLYFVILDFLNEKLRWRDIKEYTMVRKF